MKLKFNYINPENQTPSKNFYTSSVSTTSTQPVTFSYMNSFEKASNNMQYANKLNFVSQKSFPQIEALLIKSSAPHRAKNYLVKQKKEWTLRKQIQDLRIELQQKNKEFVELNEAKTQARIMISSLLEEAYNHHLQLINANLVCEQELKQLREILKMYQD